MVEAGHKPFVRLVQVPADRKERHCLSHDEAVETQCKGTVLAAKAVETPCKDSALVAKAVETQYKDSAVPKRPAEWPDRAGGGRGRQSVADPMLVNLRSPETCKLAHQL